MKTVIRSLVVTMAFGLAWLAANPAAAQDPYVGEIRILSFRTGMSPQGWAECNGQLLQINQNQALYSLLGTTYGGDGKTNFALPDLRGRVPMGAGQGTGLTARTVGQKGGQEVVEVPLLSACVAPVAPVTADGVIGKAGDATAMKVVVPPATAAPAPKAPAPVKTDNMPPFVVLRYFMATQGIYPAAD